MDDELFNEMALDALTESGLTDFEAEQMLEDYQSFN